MEPQYKLAFDQMMEEGLTLGEIIEHAILYAAEVAVVEISDDGATLDPDDAYDAIRDGIRSGAEVRVDGCDPRLTTNTQLQGKIKYWNRAENVGHPAREARLKMLEAERLRRGLSAITA